MTPPDIRLIRSDEAQPHNVAASVAANTISEQRFIIVGPSRSCGQSFLYLRRHSHGGIGEADFQMPSCFLRARSSARANSYSPLAYAL